MSYFNNIGNLYDENNVDHGTGFIIRIAISARDISLIITSEKNVSDKKMFIRFDNDALIEIILHKIDSGIAFYIPTTLLHELFKGYCFYRLDWNRNNDKKYFLWKYNTKTGYHPHMKYENAEGSVVSTDLGNVIGMIVNNNIIDKHDIRNAVGRILDGYFKK